VTLLADKIPDFATTIPLAQVELLATQIELFEGPSLDCRSTLARLVSNPRFKMAVTNLFEAWSMEPGLSGQAIALALRSAGRTAEQLRSASSTEVVWTGPSSVHIPVRQSGQVLLNLIERARKRLIIVSFAATHVDVVEGALRSAYLRGVDIRLVLETREDSDGRLSADASRAFSKLKGFASFWVWPKDQRPDGGASMHAKTAICDSQAALVTSANLTGFGLERNMELGLVITGGPVPKRMSDHFEALMATGVLIEVTPWAVH
jgi:phosphatidylserine/phosphatidylglycerophosphate/cardiolipin synthase-like enzyme